MLAPKYDMNVTTNEETRKLIKRACHKVGQRSKHESIDFV